MGIQEASPKKGWAQTQVSHLRETNFYNLPPTYITIGVVYYAIDTPSMAMLFGKCTDDMPNN